MKKWAVLLFTVFTTFLLVACSENSSETQDNNNAENTSEIVNNDETEENDEEDVNDENMNEDEENTESEDTEKETFADDVTVLDVDEVYLDQEETSDVLEVDPSLVEYEEQKYIESELVTSLLDKEITYDPDEKVAEVFDEKGDFTYQPEHEDEEGALIDVGQYYLESIDDYFTPADDEVDQYNFLEFEGNLYLPRHLIMRELKTPVNYIRRDHKLEFGLQEEATDIYDQGIGNSNDSYVYATDESSDVTIDGENYDQGIKFKDVSSSARKLNILAESQYTNFSGFVYHKEGDYPIEIRLLDSDKDTIEVIGTVDPGETMEFDIDVSGLDEFNISAENTEFNTAEMEAILFGELE